MFCAALFAALCLLLPQAAAAMTPDEALGVLGDRSSSFEQKKEAFDVIGDSKEGWSQLLLESAQKGELFFDKKSKEVYAKVGENYFKVKGGEAFSGKSRERPRANRKRLAGGRVKAAASPRPLHHDRSGSFGDADLRHRLRGPQ